MKSSQAKKADAANPLFGQFDEMVDAVLAPPEKGKSSTVDIKKGATVETWAIPLSDIYQNSDLRLDASHYDRDTFLAISELRKSKCELEQLSAMASVNLPGQFVRIWATDPQYGRRYVNASELMSLAATGTLGGKQRILSQETETDIGELIIHKGWLLMSCSGTIGRLFYVTDRLDGWAATHDLIRIIPNKGIPIGYLYAYLSSDVAQKQILGFTHGGQIDHVTHHQVGSVLVPRLPDDQMKAIHKDVMHAFSLREKAIESLIEATATIENAISK